MNTAARTAHRGIGSLPRNKGFSWRKSARHEVRRWQLYALLVLPLAYLFIFHYGSMYGLLIAFKNFNAMKGILGSDWVGMKWINKFISSHNFWQIVRNTLGLSMYSLLAGFPIPIILALAINACQTRWFKKTVQMGTYAPYFLSVTVVVSMLYQFLAEKTGVVNTMLFSLTGERISFLTRPGIFQHLYVWSDVWQYTGYNSIIYIAALSSIDPSLHEAATVDGANKFQRTWHVDLPGILPTATILLILRIGQIMNVGFEKVYLMQNPMNISRSQIINTYIYQQSIGSQLPNFSYSTAVGLFNSVINFILLLTVNGVANRTNGSGMF
ncbi:sugar ABC transporter permease [Clostridia bacterium]|nr:sugar ABC transporter permease [Clostridia bacterium]